MASGIILIIISYFRLVSATIEPFIVGGNYTSIEKYPFLAHIRICNEGPTNKACLACGSSILNQNILLTAAHCFDSCNSTTKLQATVGNDSKKLGSRHSIEYYKVHEDYAKANLINDIALAKVEKPFKFGSTVQRIILSKTPVSDNYDKSGNVAGWGLTDEQEETMSYYLKELTDQRVWERHKCLEIHTFVPLGAFCAGNKHSTNYASRGDSGSPLVVQGTTQIGLVSFKTPLKSRSLMVYTDIGYFYNWIVVETLKLMCPN